MSTPKAVWEELEKAFGQSIGLWCDRCKPTNDGGSRKTCEHNERRLWIHGVSSALGRPFWDIMRERPAEPTTNLCRNKKCKRTKRCGKAHSDAELKAWAILHRHGYFVHSFPQRLMYSEETPDPASSSPRNATVTPKKRARKKATSPRNYHPPEVSHKSMLNKFVSQFGGGRFLLACKNCYNLEPRIVMEMEIDDGGKGPRIYCRWCLLKEFLLLYEITETNDNGVTFYEYQIARTRLSTTSGNSLCSQKSACRWGKECTFAHSAIELAVWRLESSGTTPIQLARHCNRKADKKRPTLDGMFHCDRCCLSFSDHRAYCKYMDTAHQHFLEICRPPGDAWTYSPPPDVQFTLCRYEPCACHNAHSQDEFKEWSTRRDIKEARKKFVLKERRKGSGFDFEKTPQPLEEKWMQGYEKKTIRLEDKLVIWKIKLSCPKSVALNRIGFPQSEHYKMRMDNGPYTREMEVPGRKDTTYEFSVFFENPQCLYGVQPGNLYLEFTDNLLCYKKFEVEVMGSGVDIPVSSFDPNDWIQHRNKVKFPGKRYQLPTYEITMKDLEEKYPLRAAMKLEKTENEAVTPKNYKDQMHSFLYREENARKTVLTRLNMICTLKFGNVLPEGNLLAQFSLPVSVSTDEGMLFKTSCSMLYIGDIGRDDAFECKIASWNVEVISILLSSECVRSLMIQPTSQRDFLIQFQLDRELFCKRHYAIDKIDSALNLICPAPGGYAALYHGANTSFQQLDGGQNAVYNFLRAPKETVNGRNKKVGGFPPLIVAGPFGTGKTHTIKEILLDLLEENNGKCNTILLCTHTNSAADLYLMDARIQKYKAKVLRLFTHMRDSSRVNLKVLQFCLLGENGFRYPSIEEARKYRLIITTFTTALDLILESGLPANAFTHIFLDEASQAMEPDVIMPLLLADPQNTRIVIAGDHRQTTERLYSDHLRPTLLERMYEAYENVSKRCRILLTNNYRCVDGILSLLSKLFYKGNVLTNAGNVECIRGMQSTYFIHLQGTCTETREGDYVNESEAQQIMFEAKMLVRQHNLVKEEEIVVISAFYTQVVYIRQILRKEGLRNVSVQTLQNIQGQQFKVVILSCVMRRLQCLKTYGENFGFLSDYRMLNTALTRAQSLIVVVGDAVTLCSEGECKKYWKTFIKHCEEQRTILPQNINVKSVRREIDLAKHKLSADAPEFRPFGSGEQDTTEEENQDEQDSQSATSGTVDDDNDSWCSEESEDDLILDDMIKKTTGIDLTKVTVGVGDIGDEYVRYSSDEDEGDPNLSHTSSRRRARREAIYPKYTMGQLEQMLARDNARYKRCRIKMVNWFTARAIPLDDVTDAKKEMDEIDAISQDDEVITEGTLSDTTSSDDSEDSDSESRNETDSQISEVHTPPPPVITVHPEIFIETRRNVGRTFDQDEALVEITETRNDPTRPNMIRRVGKILGVLRKRIRNPRERYFLCRPDEFNPCIMCPFDRKVTRIPLLIPREHSKRDARARIPIYKIVRKGGKWADLKHLGFEKPDDQRVYVVRYLKWSEYCLYPLGFVESSFEIRDFRKYLTLEYAVPQKHRNAALREAKDIMNQYQQKPSQDAIEVFTIDPKGSKDLDDAISFHQCKEHRGCYKIGIHITDVASVISEGSELDKDAQRRFSTFYGDEDNPIHMLPRDLSTDKCSLLPNCVRSAITTYFHSIDGPPHAKDFTPVEPVRTLIRSTRRLDYKEAEDLIRAVMREKKLLPKDYDLAIRLSEMWRIMMDWRISRLRGEAYYKNADRYQDLLEECRAHLLIEEAMITVNANTAGYLLERNFEIPMRAQDAPDEVDWTGWETLNHNLIPNSTYLKSCSKYLRRIKNLEEGADESEADVSDDDGDEQWEEVRSRNKKRKRKKRETNKVNTSIDSLDEVLIFENYWNDMVKCFDNNDLELMSFVAACDDLHPSMIGPVDRYRSIQKKSSFKTSDASHFSLRLERYAWNSSPIRRYIDIVIQRCLHKALDNELATEKTQRDVQVICGYSDNRHSQYENKLICAKAAQSLQQQPMAFEACVTQITDAFISIAIPSLGKVIIQRDRELLYGYLMLTNAKKQISDAIEEDNQPRIDGKTHLTSIELVWKLRYYNYDSKCHTSQSRSSPVTMKIPVKDWKKLVNIISTPPRKSESDYTKQSYDYQLKMAFKDILKNAAVEEVEKTDELTDATRNHPEKIRHRREIHWKTRPGTSVLVQLTGSRDRSRLPTPAVQLLAISDNLDICVEHIREPLNIYAKDAAKTTGANKSLSAYRKKWEPLVRMDAAYTGVKENSSITIQGVSIEREKIEPHADYDDSSDEESSPQTFSWLFKLKYKFCYDRYIDFHKGDLLCLRLKGVPCNLDNHYIKVSGGRSTFTPVVHGVIFDVKNLEIDSNDVMKDNLENIIRKVYFTTFSRDGSDDDSILSEDPDAKWTVEVIPLSYLHRHMHTAFDILKICPPLVKSICLGTVQPCPVKRDKRLEGLVAKSLDKFPYQLNKQQRQEEQNAVRKNFSIIQGPPGTGKSFMAAQIAAKFAYINKHMGRNEKVLYCGPSNKSVDVAAGFLKNVNDLKIVRMYSSSLEEKLYPNPLKPAQTSSVSGDDGKKPDENLKRVALHELIRSPENTYSTEIKEFDSKVKSGKCFERKQMDYYTALVAGAKAEELKKADIVICTCSKSCQLMEYDCAPNGVIRRKSEPALKFSQCIIDECAMCSEPETILPLVATNPSQIVLIGDHRQLLPVITCTKAEKLGLGESLFSRYLEYVGMLTNQYRMHPNIMEFPSNQFYDRKLTCDQSVMQRSKLRNDPFQSKNEAIFWNVPGEERVQQFKTAEEGDQSKYNMAQARAVIKILLVLTRSQIKTSQIMVLSPYTAQCARIREMTHNKFSSLKDVHVGTVVTSQGSEADFVILSTVRSLPESSIMQNANVQWLRKNLGFLTDPNQINVALTRARRRLFIIGNQKLLKVDALWEKLLNVYERKGAVTNDLIGDRGEQK